MPPQLDRHIQPGSPETQAIKSALNWLRIEQALGWLNEDEGQNHDNNIAILSNRLVDIGVNPEIEKSKRVLLSQATDEEKQIAFADLVIAGIEDIGNQKKEYFPMFTIEEALQVIAQAERGNLAHLSAAVSALQDSLNDSSLDRLTYITAQENLSRELGVLEKLRGVTTEQAFDAAHKVAGRLLGLSYREVEDNQTVNFDGKDFIAKHAEGIRIFEVYDDAETFLGWEYVDMSDNPKKAGSPMAFGQLAYVDDDNGGQTQRRMTFVILPKWDELIGSSRFPLYYLRQIVHEFLHSVEYASETGLSEADFGHSDLDELVSHLGEVLLIDHLAEVMPWEDEQEKADFENGLREFFGGYLPVDVQIFLARGRAIVEGYNAVNQMQDKTDRQSVYNVFEAKYLEVMKAHHPYRETGYEYALSTRELVSLSGLAFSGVEYYRYALGYILMQKVFNANSAEEKENLLNVFRGYLLNKKSGEQQQAIRGLFLEQAA